MPHPTVGHVHLQVADLERSLKFYRDLLGFEVTTRMGDSAVFLSSGGYHHHIGLNTWAGPVPPNAGMTAGLYHAAYLYPTRKALAEVVKRLIDAKYPISGAADHGVSEAIYLEDPDGIGVEIYSDRPRSEWKVKNDGEVDMVTEPLDMQSLLRELE